MKNRLYFCLLLVTALLVGGCKVESIESSNKKYLEKLRQSSTQESESESQTPLENGILLAVEIRELRDVFSNRINGLISLSYDDKFYYLSGIDPQDSTRKIIYTLDKKFLNVKKEEFEDLEKDDKIITVSNIAGTDEIKSTVAESKGADFSSWIIKMEGDHLIYHLDTGEKINAETAEYIN